MSPSDRPRIPPSLQPRDEPVPELPPEPAPPADTPPTPPPTGRGRRAWRIFKWTLLGTFLLLVLLALVPPAVVLWLRSNPPPTTAFMMRSATQPVQYAWVPKDQIPESLRLAVVAAEDQKFWTHWGFDFIAIAEALEHNEKSKKKRGASTITQQTAKNLFLWPSRSWLRKGLEVTFTLLLEGLWPKERILEVYLNIVELGPGIYGCEAAAQKFFKKNCAKLTPSETAHLAAVLPSPTKWRADRPGPYVQSRVDWILSQIGQPPRYAPVPEEEPEVPAGDAPAEPGLDEMTPDPSAGEMPAASQDPATAEPAPELMPGDSPADLQAEPGETPAQDSGTEAAPQDP